MQRKILTWLIILYGLFVVYNILLPFSFHFSPEQIQQDLKNFISFGYLAGSHISLTDIAGNILIFVPLGFLLGSLLYLDGKKRIVLLTTLTGFVFSFFLELLQLFISKRNTALHDVLTNTTGTLIGVLLASFYSWQVSRSLNKHFYSLLNRRPFLLIPLIIGIAQLFAASMPFTVSITVSSLKKSLKAANLFPFAYNSIGNAFFNSPNKNDLLPFDAYAFLENVLFWMVFGYVFFLCYRIYWRKKPFGRLLIIGIPLLYFPLLEFMQLFIVSRVADINDILSGYMGVAGGYLAYWLLKPLRHRQFKTDLDLLKIPLLLYFLFILCSGLKPFHYIFTSEFLKTKLLIQYLIPFYAYFKKASLQNIYDLINSLSFYIPISLYLSYVLRKKVTPFPKIYSVTIISGLVVGVFIELNQIFLETRVGEITDAIAYGVGGGVGTFIIYYYEKEIMPKLKLIRDGVIRYGS